MITQQIKINLIPGQVLPRFNVSQYDKDSRTLRFLLYNGEQVFTIPSGMTAQITGTKPDNKGFAYTVASAESGGNLIVADLEQQMTAVAGEVKCELILKQNAQRLGTCNFIIFVENAALSEDADISETELPAIIEEATAQMEAAAESASQAATSATSAASSASSASTSASNAATSESNAATSASNASTSEANAATSENNASTSATNASESATSASTSATNANADALKSEGYAVGKQNGVDVGSDSEYYHNNAKYFKEQASSIVDCVSWDDFAELGAVNLCENVFTSQVINGVTFTKNSDGSLTVSGTASENITTFNYTDGYIFKTTLNAGTYKLSVGQSTRRIFYRLGDTSKQIPASGTDTFTVDTDNTALVAWFYCSSGYVASETYYPMLTLTNYNGDYAPYAKTNKKLTDAVATNTTDISTLQNNIGTLTLTGVLTISANGNRNFTIPNNYRGVCYVFGAGADRIAQVMLYCTNAGGIYYKEIASADNVSFSTSTNTLTITNSTSSSLSTYFLNLRESASA